MVSHESFINKMKNNNPAEIIKAYEAAYLAANNAPATVFYAGKGWYKINKNFGSSFRTKEIIAATDVLNERAKDKLNNQ